MEINMGEVLKGLIKGALHRFYSDMKFSLLVMRKVVTVFCALCFKLEAYALKIVVV